MKSLVQRIADAEPKTRRAIIMTMDMAMVVAAIPLSLLLSQSDLSFEAFSPLGTGIWIGVIAFSHLTFRFSRLYNTVWRFASTPDFFNIIKGAATLAFALYLVAITVRLFIPVTGLNERQFLAFFLVTFALICAPRLFYRYAREGSGWNSLRRRAEADKQAVFVGLLNEADIIIRFTQTHSASSTRMVGIMAVDERASLGMQVRGVPIVAVGPRLAGMFEEFVKGTTSIDRLIFGHGPERQVDEFAELVRVARRYGIAVSQFSGFTQLERGGELVLDAVEMETILRRATVPTDTSEIGGFVAGKRVFVTGGAGSIGRKLVQRSLEFGAEAVMVADHSEFRIFQLGEQVNALDAERLSTRIIDVCDRQLLARAVREFKPDIMFHAAALKHVPLLEENWAPAIKTNVFGTQICAEVALECQVPHFVLISSDKAADPSSILGLTKRLAEQIVDALRASGGEGRKEPSRTNFIAVRFGNVFASDGSVATVFERQIQMGGPVTVTDRAMTRYMMTVGEAVDLVILAAALSSRRGEARAHGIYMLDMGQPVSILSIAETMIRLAGKRPYLDIPIEFTGIRPGEKLHEALSAQDEEIVRLEAKSVFGLNTAVSKWVDVRRCLIGLQSAIAKDDRQLAERMMRGLAVPHAGGVELEDVPLAV